MRIHCKEVERDKELVYEGMCSEYGRWDGLIAPHQVLRKGYRGKISNNGRRLLLSPAAVITSIQWFVHWEQRRSGKPSSSERGGRQTEVSHRQLHSRAGCVWLTGSGGRFLSLQNRSHRFEHV